MSNAWLEVHIFGGSSEGEAIVVRMPDGQYGVIDSISFKDTDGISQYPVNEFLERRGIKSLAFVCLTHPHRDHFLGMSQLLEKWPPKEFWRSGSLSPVDFARIVKREYLPAVSNGDNERRNAADELRWIGRWVSKQIDKAKRGSGSLFALRSASIHKTMYPLAVSKSKSFQFLAIAPHDNEIDGYTSSLQRCFEVDGTLKLDQPSLDENRVSIALLFESKNFSIVLGGDTLNANWRHAINELGASRFASRLVKVSHHGSDTAYSDELWDALSPQNSPSDTVVTGFRRSRLPTEEMLKKLLAKSRRLYLTHSSHLSTRGEKPLSQPERSASTIDKAFRVKHRNVDLVSKSRDKIAATFAATERTAPPGVGICSFLFNKSGELLDNKIDSPAIALS